MTMGAGLTCRPVRITLPPDWCQQGARLAPSRFSLRPGDQALPDEQVDQHQVHVELEVVGVAYRLDTRAAVGQSSNASTSPSAAAGVKSSGSIRS